MFYNTLKLIIKEFYSYFQYDSKVPPMYTFKWEFKSSVDRINI